MIIDFARWRSNDTALAAHNGPLGIRMRSDQPPALIEHDLGRFDLVALEFQDITDGRSYSHARILRDRYGFRKDLRAVGDVIEDQIFFMARAGINEFELAGDRDIARAIAALSDFSVAYQAASDKLTPAYKLRHGSAID